MRISLRELRTFISNMLEENNRGLWPGMLAIHFNPMTGKQHQCVVLGVEQDGTTHAAFFTSKPGWAKAQNLKVIPAPEDVMSPIGFKATTQTYMAGQTDIRDNFKPVPRAGRVPAATVNRLWDSLL